MANSLGSKLRRPRAAGILAGVLVVGAAALCSLCLANGDAGAGAGVLLVFGMAAIAVLGDRSQPRRAAPRSEPRLHGATHLSLVSAR